MEKDISQRKIISAVLGLVLLFAACAPVPGKPSPALETPTIPKAGDTNVTAAQADTEPPMTAAVTATPAATKPASETVDAEVRINKQGTLAPNLVDGQGRSLYVYLDDTQNSSSACVDDCAVDWPPLLVTGSPSAGKGLDTTLLNIVERDDGSRQVTYNGWPLYYYTMDTFPGTTNGQGYNGVWFLVSPEGKPIQ